MREAIERYVKREVKREQFRQSAIAAWNDDQATGLPVTADEADILLTRLEEDEDVEPPECHG
ncbi:MAG: hypothetical protein P4M00_07285 [Azospirillaceae bacterium]|nr:hypothetical protein [Azospirillaceae bacterium]